MSWRRHFRVIKTQQTQSAPPTDRYSGGSGTSANFASYLPMVYAGHPNRIQRYYQFDDMDRDSDINAALDTIADFSTLSEEHSDEPFEFKYTGEPNESETKILKTMMAKWIKLNNFNSRLWYMFRDTLKNGDAFFLRDPETQEWLWLDHFMVEMVKVDDTMGKKPEEYLVRGLDYNKQTKFGSKQADPNQYRTPYGTSNIGASRVSSSSASSGPAAFSLAGTAADPRQRHMLGPFSQEVSVVDAEHVVHLSLSIGNDINWPFGTSILEPIFKVFKQKELLEDSVIIYRVQRAPERRIFYIDVGTMPPERAKRHIEMIKNDIHQRRIPNRTGTGGNMLDAAYNPLCLDLATKVPLLDGRVLSISELITEHKQRKENWVTSCDPKTGDLTVGPITWAGVTRTEAEVIKLTFTNNESLILTPDHKIPVLGKGRVQAKDLTSEDNLITSDKSKVRLVSIEPAGKMDVGTLTIAGNNPNFGHHNFATFSKVIVYNSINDDYFFAQCISLMQKMHTLDGRTLTLQEVISEFEDGKDNYVYSLNRETHDLEPGRIVWAGITRRDAEMVRVTLDNGEYIDVTPDHRFIMRDGSEREAKDLKRGNSLMPLYLKEGRTGPNQKNAGYMRYVSNAKGTKTKFVHTTICPKPPGRDYVVHHKDFNGMNNNPTNLEVMTWDDHEQLHKDAGTYSLNSQWGDPEARAKIIAGMRRLYDEATPEFNEKLAERNTINGANTWKNPETAEKARADLRVNCNKQLEERRLQYSPEMFDRLVELFNAGHDSVTKMCKVLRGDNTFQHLYQQANINTKRCVTESNVGGWIGDTTLNKIVETAGYSSWGDFKKHYNHKVVSVVLLPYREDTGDITIESPSGSHVFALAAGVYVHNSSDGRGSKVETLPGGDGNNEILDLMFFTRKLARGLRVPTSYINLGEDESSGGPAFNDGKLGAAMIQEFRFTKYCMRWQNLLSPVFDKEFKRYLTKNGIEMDWSLFELRFTPPQSFTRYRQIELDAQRVQVYQGVSENKKLAERFKMKRFLGLTEDEMLENEKLWSEENSDKLKKKTGSTPAEGGMSPDGLSSVGVRPMDDEMGGEMPEMPPEDGGMPPEGGAAGGPAPPPPGPGPAAPPPA